MAESKVREGTVRYGKHQRTRNSNIPMPGPSKKRGNVMSTSKNTEEGLLKGGGAHKVDLEMTIIHSGMKRKES